MGRFLDDSARYLDWLRVETFPKVTVKSIVTKMIKPQMKTENALIMQPSDAKLIYFTIVFILVNIYKATKEWSINRTVHTHITHFSE